MKGFTMTKALVLHSGGLDSSVCLAMAVKDHGAQNVKSVSMNYGQRHKVEMDYAQALCNKLGVERKVIELPRIDNSLLTDDTKEIPKTTYDKIEGVSPMYVPFRNGLMLSAIASVAQAEDYDLIYYGAHAEDAFNWAYPDCTPEFNGAMANAIYVGTYHKTRLLTPLQWMKKYEIVLAGERLTLPFDLTWSCYNGGELHCGECATCQARKQAFVDARVQDPTAYQV